jgi:hypothetical protein
VVRLREGTGTDAGFSTEDQIKIMLRRILDLGGTAQITGFYNAVEEVLQKQGWTLSKQGKTSIRFFINKVAVEKGYVLPHDKENPGWHITPEGRQFIEPDSPTNQLNLDEKMSSAQDLDNCSTKRIEKTRLSGNRKSDMAISLEMLELTLSAMPSEQFRQIWGELYDRLIAEERAKAITLVTDKELLSAARQPVRRIQDFLQGRGNETPKSEELCDWIHFCYTLGLFREGSALWRLVQPEGVNQWQYERTKKIAAVCRARVG